MQDSPLSRDSKEECQKTGPLACLPRTVSSLMLPDGRRRARSLTEDVVPVVSNERQLVLCRPGGGIVVHDRRNRTLAVRGNATENCGSCSASSIGATALMTGGRPSAVQCPLCGNDVAKNPEFVFQAASYFKVLQDLFAYHCQQDASGGSKSSNSKRCSAKRAKASSRVFAAGVLSNDEIYTSESPSSSVPVSPRHNPFIPRMNGVGEDDDFEGPRNIPLGSFLTGYYDCFFHEVKPLGSGSYGQVYLCQHFMDDVHLGEYAVKKVPVGDNKAWLSKMLREVKVRERLHNANIVEYKHSWLELHRGSAMMPRIPWLFVLMEYCNGGDLESFLRAGRFAVCEGCESLHKVKSLLPEAMVWKLFFDMANGLNHLHHSGILHRDLKPQNILLHCNMDAVSQRLTATALLCDFGTSHLKSEKARRADHSGFTGTVEFTAPELLATGDSCYGDEFDEKSDIWSLGVILFWLCFGHLPWSCSEASSPAEIRQMVIDAASKYNHIPTPADTPRSKELILLVEALLQKDPRLRPAIDEIMAEKSIHKRLWDQNALRTASEELALGIVYSQNKQNTDPRDWIQQFK